MHAWVTSNGRSNSQPPTASASGFDALGDTQKRHPYQTQSQLPVPPVQDNPPPQSRAPTTNANAGRIAAASRIQPQSSRLGHYRDGSLPIAQTRTTVDSNLPGSRRPAPFWEGSTIEGSLLSDTASNVDANPALPLQYHRPAYEPSHRRREIPRHRPFRKASPGPESIAPFMIGPNGMIEEVEDPLTRRTSTPDARSNQEGFKPASYVDSDPYSDDSPTSPEKASPSNKRLHPKQLALRTSRGGSFSGRTTFPDEDNLMSSPQQQAYQNLENGMEGPHPLHAGRSKVKTEGNHRPTVFAHADTPMVNNPDSETESVEQQATPKPAVKSKPQVARQLFSRNGKANVNPHESAMPRQSTETRHSSSKKRAFELDYDDSALAHMSYADLRKQPFDFDPTQAEAQSVGAPPQGTLSEKLDHFLGKDQATQADFFTRMSVDDWEDSGDWFLERFGKIVHKIKQARQSKRATVEGFESEIAEREEAVRNKTHGIGRRLAELKSEGEGLMRKEFD
ncbi:hypothetical protein DL764_000780 [Monosporascus ibericus]|uniref:Extracellular mutant protein 11 C-terminal domain-containing protein n=1 Tax=Monosporascus ibericus TaxID=155417 RepID=A0A4Q4TU05_9PEZI|nr:hypothetical protein DL764_000780 [Monosporascus ibericus]